MNNTGTNKKIKEEYKKNIKEKNYSKSIDTNIPKNKVGSSNAVSSNPPFGHHSNNNVTETTRIKVNNMKSKK